MIYLDENYSNPFAWTEYYVLSYIKKYKSVEVNDNYFDAGGLDPYNFCMNRFCRILYNKGLLNKKKHWYNSKITYTLIDKLKISRKEKLQNISKKL